MGVLSDQHNEWLDQQRLEARLQEDPELRGLLRAAFKEGQLAAYRAEREGLDGSEVTNPYSGHDD